MPIIFTLSDIYDIEIKCERIHASFKIREKERITTTESTITTESVDDNNELKKIKIKQSNALLKDVCLIKTKHFYVMAIALSAYI